MTNRALIWLAVSSEAQAAEDKVSLDEQERAARQFAGQSGYTVVDVLRWDGYSRWESDVITALDDYATQGRLEYHRLREMWQRRAFDVLICYTHSRLGRSFTMQSWVIENVIRSGARVYRIMGGWIDNADYLPQIAIGGMSSASEIDQLKKRRDSGMTGRAKRGLPTGSKIPISHVLIRDDLGRAIRLAVDESKRLLWDDLASALIKGTGYAALERVLHEDYGHSRFATKYFYKLLHNPVFWGHSARYHRMKPGNPRRRIKSDEFGAWAYDLSIAPPEGVLFYPNTHEPVYTGEAAERVKAELARRQDMRGKRRPHSTSALSGCLQCDYCGSTYTAYNDGSWRAYRCKRGRACAERHYLPHKRAMQEVHKILTELLAANDASVLDKPVEVHEPTETALQAELEKLEAQARRLVGLQARAPDSLQAMYAEELAAIASQLDTVKARLTSLRRAASSSQRQAQRIEYEALQQVGLDALWRLPEVEINQHVRMLLGKMRFVCRGGHIVDVR